MELSSSSSNLETPVNPGAGAGQVVPRTLSLAVSNMDSDSDSGEEEVLEVGLVAGGGSVVSPPAAAPRAGGAVAAADSDSDSGDEEVLEVAVVGVQSPPFQSAAPVETPLPAVWPRYQQSQEAVRQVISQSMESRLHGQSTGPMGQVIATLTDLTASPFCRRLAMDYLERWLSTPAQSQKAKTLLAAVIREVDPACPDDAGVIEALLNLKLPVQQDKLFTESIAALVQKQPQVLHKVLRFFLTEGVSSSSSGTSSYKALARILAHALQSQQQQQQEGRCGRASNEVDKSMCIPDSIRRLCCHAVQATAAHAVAEPSLGRSRAGRHAQGVHPAGQGRAGQGGVPGNGQDAHARAVRPAAAGGRAAALPHRPLQAPAAGRVGRTSLDLTQPS